MDLEVYLLVAPVRVDCSLLTSLPVHHLIWVKLEKLVSYLYFIIAVCSLFAALADADPLGVNQNVTFDEVGGLEDRTSC